ncbi:hypothetical protein AB8880_09310 [Alphaproteobacteria bacterium LSUCC0684]
MAKAKHRTDKKIIENADIPAQSVRDIYVNTQNILAQYQERSDLLIEALEKHDPGFVQRMNKMTEEKTARSHESILRFHERQAYVIIVLSVVGVVFLLGLFAVLALQGNIDFTVGLLIIILISVIQSGPGGLMAIASAVVRLIDRIRKE